MKSFAEIDRETQGEYLKLLAAVSKLSGLFSESAVPFVNYRVAENIFCRSFGADNLSRSDTAFDAKYHSLGIGLKTFTCTGNHSLEKVAEFNTVSSILSELSGQELAQKIAQYRNERIDLALRLYNIEQSIYHIVARRENELLLFETDYGYIDIANISNIKSTKASLQFEDGNNFYSYNYSKSTLYRKFSIPQNAFRLPVDTIEDPYSLLLDLFKDGISPKTTEKLIKGVHYVILPLYGTNKAGKCVFERSGLNQWNANGRKRDVGEMYIPVPVQFHRAFPDFFPQRDIHFELSIPTGKIFTAKLCQDNAKALMTDPNKALSDWLLRRVFGLKKRELATIERMDSLGFDSVYIQKTNEGQFKIDIAASGSYESFMERDLE